MQRVAKHLYRRGNSYTFRRAIPEYARQSFGGLREYVRSLGDVTEGRAKALATIHREYCDRLIGNARGKVQATRGVSDIIRVRRIPDHDEIERAVRRWLVTLETNVSDLASLSQLSIDDYTRDLGFLDAEVIRVMRARGPETPLMTKWIAEALIQSNDWSCPADSKLRTLLEKTVARGQRELFARLRAELNWEDQPQPTHRLFSPEAFARDRDAPVSAPRSVSVPIMEMFEGYRLEQEPKQATVKAWKSALASLIAHLGHDDAGQVSSEDIVSWKNALLMPAGDGKRVRNQYTVRHKYLGAVKPVFGWGVSNKLITSNPVIGVKVSVPRRERTRTERGYSDAEAKIVLRAALAINTEEERTFIAFARRWLPWLCAYTGARGSEIAQLRAEDLGQTEGGVWYVKVTPEAGSQKGGFARLVALHPHLIEQGFVKAVNKRSGPLFYDPKRKTKGSNGNPQYKKVAQRVADWVRELGVTDRELQPNHGWRHRFATVARGRMDPDIRRAFIGHAPEDEHQAYGDVLVADSYAALLNFPRYEWEQDSAPPARHS